MEEHTLLLSIVNEWTKPHVCCLFGFSFEDERPKTAKQCVLNYKRKGIICRIRTRVDLYVCGLPLTDRGRFTTSPAFYAHYSSNHELWTKRDLCTRLKTKFRQLSYSTAVSCEKYMFDHSFQENVCDFESEQNICLG